MIDGTVAGLAAGDSISVNIGGQAAAYTVTEDDLRAGVDQSESIAFGLKSAIDGLGISGLTVTYDDSTTTGTLSLANTGADALTVTGQYKNADSGDLSLLATIDVTDGSTLSAQLVNIESMIEGHDGGGRLRFGREPAGHPSGFRLEADRCDEDRHRRARRCRHGRGIGPAARRCRRSSNSASSRCRSRTSSRRTSSRCSSDDTRQGAPRRRGAAHAKAARCLPQYRKVLPCPQRPWPGQPYENPAQPIRTLRAAEYEVFARVTRRL